MAAVAFQSAPSLGRSLGLGSVTSVTSTARRENSLLPPISDSHQQKRHQVIIQAVVSNRPAKPPKGEGEIEWTFSCETGAFPKGKFEGKGAHDSTVPFATRNDAVFLSFDFKEDVPLRTILKFMDTSQGLSTFDGVPFKGRLIPPNIYEAYARMPHLLDAPWVEAAASVPGCRFGAFAMETTSEEDVAAMKDVLGPLIESLDVAGPEAYEDLYLI